MTPHPEAETSADVSAAAAKLFANSFGGDAEAVGSAPGRVNLIGEHTDYNDGLVLPFAIDARTAVAGRRRPDGVVRLVSAQRPGELIEIPAGQQDPETIPAEVPTWIRYPLGVVWALREWDSANTAALKAGFDLAITSTVPVGAGLSSSAAMECATGVAVASLVGVAITPDQLARVSQRAENEMAGVPSGLMDQMASAACRAGSVLFFDVQSGVAESIPFDPAASSLSVLVIDTHAHHQLADGEYAVRRRQCEAAAAWLGVPSLRAIGDLPAALAELTDPLLRRRVRHVVTENQRVVETVAALRAGRVAAIGPLLTASHRSLAEDFEVSCEELDLAVAASVGAGALGARMTGGGFGGSAIALVPEDLAGTVTDRVVAAFGARGLTQPTVRAVSPAAGATSDR